MEINLIMKYWIFWPFSVLVALIKSIIWIALNPIRTYKAISLMQEEKKKLKVIADVYHLMSEFRWKKEASLFDFLPLFPIIVFAKNFVGDCDDAAALAKWAFKQLGIKGNIYRLSGSGNSRHAIFVNKQKTWMVSNSSVVPLNPDNWEHAVVSWSWHNSKHYEISNKLL